MKRHGRRTCGITQSKQISWCCSTYSAQTTIKRDDAETIEAECRQRHGLQVQDGSVQDIEMGHVENVSDEIVLSRITNIESCREKNKLETQPSAQLHSKQTKELRGWGGKCRNWRNATPTFRNGTILVSEYGVELEYTGLWRTTWPHQHLQDTKKCDNSADKHRFVICRTDHASTWEESAGFWPFWTGGHDCKEYYWGRRYRKPIDYKFKNGTMPKTSEREVAH